MELVIKAKRRDSGKLVYLSDPNDSHAQTEAKFMPFRTNRTSVDFEWVELIEGEVGRRERLDAPAVIANPETPKKETPMKKLKSSVALIAFAVLAFITPAVQAQSYNQAYIGGATANSPASTDNTTWYTTNTTPIVVTKAANVGLQIDHKLVGAGTSSVIFRFGASVDGVTWTSSYLLVTNTAAGTTLVSSTRDVSVGGIGFLRLESINNANATALTNLFVRYAVKTP